jgi:hypothetical protein
MIKANKIKNNPFKNTLYSLAESGVPSFLQEYLYLLTHVIYFKVVTIKKKNTEKKTKKR